VTLDPSLSAGDGAAVAGIVAGWANHVKTRDPLGLMERIYAHLPDELAALRRRRRHELGAEALQLAFAARARGDSRAARTFARRAVGYRPQALFNRGVLSLLVRTPAPDSRDATTTGARPGATWPDGERAASRGNS
jgi:hypothetical protein